MTAGWLAVAAAVALGALPDAELTAKSGVARAVAPPGAALFDLAWRVPVVRTGMHRTVPTSFGAPAVSRAHGRVVVATAEGEVLALDSGDGHVLWRYAHGQPFETAPALVATAAGELVVLGSRAGDLLALTVADGARVWEVKVEGEVRAAPRLAGDGLLVTTAANRVMYLRAATGAVVWSAGRQAATGLTVEGHARATLADGRVFATYSDGYAEALDANNGDVLWSRPLSLAGRDFFDADADPVVLGDTVYVASYSDGIYALAVADGQTRWNRAAPAVTALAAADGLLLAGSADGMVWGLGPADGALRWRVRAQRGAVSRLMVRDGLAVFTAGRFGLVALDARRGRPLHVSGVGSAGVGDPVWEGTCLSFLSSAGYLHAYRYLPARGDADRAS